MRSVLTIAGSDPSGGAGIQADLKTCAALGVYGLSAITAITAQNTMGVTAVYEAPPEIVAAQIDAVLADIEPDAVKTGMLANGGIVRVVAEKARQHAFKNLVVDTAMASKSGTRLLSDDGIEAMRALLIPLADVVTPNLPEAEALLGCKLECDEDIRDAARAIHAMGARNVVIKGGHREGQMAIDVLFDGREFHEYSAPRIETASTHGTGCTFASAIAAFLARGEAVPAAVGRAKEYVTEALRRAHPIGRGHGPVHHFWQWWEGE
jgi:hydroxymethylpyrimidine/phosphomethylpyrimidine kinase